MKEFDNLVEIVKVLRSPNGCPWDRSQTLESIVENVIEEAYEVVDAIGKEDFQKIKEEVGDLLLQSVFISQIAEEKGKFSLKEVISDLNERLVYRHPHVFKGEKLPSDTDESLKVWESKKNENGDVFSLVPNSFPTMLYIYKVIQKSKRKNLFKVNESELVDEIKSRLDKINLDNDEEVKGMVLYLLILLSMRNERVEVDIKEKFKRDFKKYMNSGENG